MKLRAQTAALFTAALLATAALPRTIATAEPAYVVVDGDTIKAPYGVTYRLMGFDTPETFRAKCEAEFQLGLAAKARLEELMASGEVKVLESGKQDKYRRTLAHLTVNGKDVGEILIAEGLARPYHKRPGARAGAETPDDEG